MSNDARLRLKWKVDLLSYLKPFRVYLSKPVNRPPSKTFKALIYNNKSSFVIV